MAADERNKLTPALSEARKRRATLHDALVHLEIAISSPAAARIPEWTALVTKEVIGVRDAFDQHVMVTEKPGGLYEEIITRAPRLDGTVRRLKDEHPEITEKVAEMVERLEKATIGGPELAARRRPRRPAALHRHRDPPSAEGRRPRLGGVQRRHRRHRIAQDAAGSLEPEGSLPACPASPSGKST